MRVKMKNLEKDFAATQQVMAQEINGLKVRLEREAEEFRLKSQIEIAAKTDLQTLVDRARAEREEAVTDKEKLEMEYGAVKNRLDEALKHPMFTRKGAVDAALHFRKIQREFDDIFSPKDVVNALHNLAYDEVRKQMKKSTGFTSR